MSMNDRMKKKIKAKKILFKLTSSVYIIYMDGGREDHKINTQAKLNSLFSFLILNLHTQMHKSTTVKKKMMCDNVQSVHSSHNNYI